MNAPQVVIGPRPVAGCDVPTSISVLTAASYDRDVVSFSVVEEIAAPHRSLTRELIHMTASRSYVERLARRIVSVACHLEMCLEPGGTIRLRRAGTFRSAWHVDLRVGNRLLVSWPFEPKTIDHLDALDHVLERGAIEHPVVHESQSALHAHMREIDATMRRDREVDELIRQNLEMPTNMLLELLETQGLLDPLDSTRAVD